MSMCVFMFMSMFACVHLHVYVFVWISEDACVYEHKSKCPNMTHCLRVISFHRWFKSNV